MEMKSNLMSTTIETIIENDDITSLYQPIISLLMVKS